jgi:hypothetical protein
MEAGLPVTRAGWILGALLLLGPARGSAQATIGEFRLSAVAGDALPATGAHAPPEFPSPGGRGLGGVSAGLSFVHGNLSVGPEAMLLRGSDRRMYQLGGIARLGLAKGRVRPFVLVGGGVYGWDRKMIAPFDSAAGARWTVDVTTFSGSAGGGVVLGARRLAIVVEARGHKSLGKKYDTGSRDLLSISAGGRFSW